MTIKDHEYRIKNVAQEIERYIAQRPNAAETAEGVTNWWLSRQRVEESIEVVTDALEYLVIQRKLVKRNLGQRTIYMQARS